MKIVKFNNGKYAVRKGGWISGYQYLDLRSTEHFWWSKDCQYFPHCLADSLEEVEERKPWTVMDNGSPVRKVNA